MLKRLWTDHRNACLLTLALLVIGVVVSPWVLLAAVVQISLVLLRTQRSQEKKSSNNLLYDEPEIDDIKDELITIPNEIKDLLSSSDWPEVQQGLELLAATGTIFSKWNSFELKDIIARIENEELDPIIRKIFEQINIEAISNYFWKEKIAQEIANLKESELDEYISIESSGSLYQQDQAYLSKEEIMERDEFNIQGLIEMAESVNCCYGTTFEEDLVLRLPNWKSIRIPKQGLLRSGIIEIHDYRLKPPSEPCAEVGMYWCCSEKKEFEIALAKNFDISLLKVDIDYFSVFGDETFLIGGIKYDEEDVDIEIEDSGMDRYGFDIQLYDKNKEGDLELIFSLKDNDGSIDDEVFLQLGLRKWLGTSPHY